MKANNKILNDVYEADWKTQQKASHNDASQKIEALIRQLARLAASEDYQNLASDQTHQKIRDE